MMFKTGDLGCWQKDGTLAHHGRADDQIKVKVRTLMVVANRIKGDTV